jgi:hypothetical protein
MLRLHLAVEQRGPARCLLNCFKEFWAVKSGRLADDYVIHSDFSFLFVRDLEGVGEFRHGGKFVENDLHSLHALNVAHCLTLVKTALGASETCFIVEVCVVGAPLDWGGVHVILLCCEAFASALYIYHSA